MVLKRTEIILIYIVIVYSVQILDYTAIKYFRKFIIKVQKLGGLYKIMLLRIRSFKKKNKKKNKSVSIISIISYIFNTLFKDKECERVSTCKLLDIDLKCCFFLFWQCILSAKRNATWSLTSISRKTIWCIFTIFSPHESLISHWSWYEKSLF